MISDKTTDQLCQRMILQCRACRPKSLETERSQGLCELGLLSDEKIDLKLKGYLAASAQTEDW